MSRLAAVALISLANPCLGQVSLESALEGFENGRGGPETVEFGNRPVEFANSQALSDASELDDIFSQFDERHLSDEVGYGGKAAIMPEWLRLGGTLSQEFAVNISHDAPEDGEIDRRGLSSAQTRLDLAADANLDGDMRVRITGYIQFDPVFRRRAGQAGISGASSMPEPEIELGEAFVQGPLSDTADLTLGRQIVVWGRSDQFRVNDILNPVDNRTPGMTDIKNLRVPVTMARLELYSGPWNASFILVPEHRFDKTPSPGSDFYRSPFPPPPRDYPRHRFGSPGVALALTGTFSGWDLSFYFARILSRRAHLEMTSEGPRRRHNRISMLGAAGNFVTGSWLLKAEAAVFSNLRFSNVSDRDFNRFTLLAGAEYSGISDTTIALEAVNSRISDFDGRLREPPDARRENEPSIAFRVNRSLLNDSLDLSMALLAVGPGGKNGGLLRLQASRDISDSIDMIGGALFYLGGSQSPFSQISDNDRIFLGLNYHF
ncbi:MAG: hypothetical protein OXN84_19145 [Albidovulum sp.]|nr:hypothetical protein [Albidovulum sp.]